MPTAPAPCTAAPRHSKRVADRPRLFGALGRAAPGIALGFGLTVGLAVCSFAVPVAGTATVTEIGPEAGTAPATSELSVDDLPVDEAPPIEEATPHPAVRLGDAGSGMLLFRGDQPGLFVPAPTLETDVSIAVRGIVARTTVRQRFHNPHEHWLEGVYVFPLPDRAAVDTLRLVVGERVIEGEIQTREDARATYEEARRSGRRAGLVEQERPNLFTTSVANLGPGDTIDVVLEYQQEVRFDSGAFSLRFPMTLTPRFVPSASGEATDAVQAVDDAERITPPHTDRPAPVALEVLLDAGLPIERVTSPSHELVVEPSSREGDEPLRVVPSAGRVPGDRDFVVRWWPTRGSSATVAVLRERHEDDDYLLLLVLPPEERVTRPLERETVFVLDTSGSMSGASIRQAKRALHLALERLRPGDTFNIVDFDSSATKVFDRAVPADPRHLSIARRRLDAMVADGGTNIADALRLALGESAEQRLERDHRLRQVVFITDGAVGNERGLFRQLHRSLGDSRLFTVGIGAAPNTHFLRGAARRGGGTHTLIASLDEVEARMRELLTKIEHAALSDLEITWDAGTWSAPADEAWPRRPSDLYLGEPLTLVARLPADVEAVRLEGRRGLLPWRHEVLLPAAADGDGLHRLWARRAVEALDDARATGVDPWLAAADPVSEIDEATIRERIASLGLRHGLVTSETSLVAVDPEPVRPDGAPIETARLPVAVPHGWQPPSGLGGSPGVLPATGTAAPLARLAGGLLVVLSILWLLALRRRSTGAP
ncbi:MAG: marine proteobacterial sortase target protein [Acidobacteriota bacterium]